MCQRIEELIVRQKELKLRLGHVTRQIQALSQEREILASEQEELKRLIALARMNSTEHRALKQDYSMEKVFPWTAELHRLREEVFRIPAFRPLQLIAINALLDNRDVILVMPTGAGKSLVYQLPSLMQTPEFADTLTVVVSPLVSLMTDQAIGLRQLNIAPNSVAVLDASTLPAEQQKIYLAISGDDRPKGEEEGVGGLRLLYVTPEKLAKSRRLMHRLELAWSSSRPGRNGRRRLARFAIDEVHCASAWGHDFRPDYKFLHVLTTQFPGVPLVGVTATASAEVILDVQRLLGLQQQDGEDNSPGHQRPPCLVLRAPLMRPNLRYEVKFQSGSLSSCFPVARDFILSEFPGQSGIVYCLSQKDTETLAAFLNDGPGVSAAPYHASMDPEERTRVHTAWLQGRIQVVVATVAFGMGIDKADVRFVLHLSLSKSLENYYQESGRAGRDCATPSRVVLFWRLADVFRLAAMVFGEQTGQAKLRHMVAYATAASTCRRRLLAEVLEGDTAPTFQDCSDWRNPDIGDANVVSGDGGVCVPCDCCECDAAATPVKADVAPLVRHMKTILEGSASSSQKRLTGAKLVDALTVSKEASVDLLDVLVKLGSRLRPPPGRQEKTRFCECLLAWCLAHGHLAMDFHFTPYSTIAYVVVPPMSSSSSSADAARPLLFAPPPNLLLLQERGHDRKMKTTTSLKHQNSNETAKRRRQRVSQITQPDSTDDDSD